MGDEGELSERHKTGTADDASPPGMIPEGYLLADDLLEVLGIHRPFFWQKACSTGDMASIAMSGLKALCTFIEALAGGHPAILAAREGRDLAKQFPGLLDDLMAPNGTGLLGKLHRAKEEGFPSREAWKVCLLKNWAHSANPLGAKTPLPPLQRVNINEALSWPLCFWSDEAVVAMVEQRFPKEFDVSGNSLAKIRKFRKLYGLERSPRIVVQYDLRWNLKYHSLPRN